MDPSRQGISDRALYTVALGLATGAAGLLAKRLVQWVWMRRRGAPPPKPLGFLRSLGGKAGANAVRTVW